MILSIIIAAYNVEKYIEKCVLSCTHQNIPINDYEIIVINDGSTDNTLSILNTLKSDIKNLRIFTQENSGLGATRNKGIDGAKGDYFWFIDGDDFIDENILNDISLLLNQNIDALVINYKTINSDYSLISYSNLDINLKLEKISGSEFYELYFEKSYSWLYLIKKSIFTDDIRFMDKINMQDSEILPKLMTKIDDLRFYDKPIYNYIQHENTFTNSNDFSKRYFYFQSIIEVKNSLEEQYRTISDNKIKRGILKKVDSINQIIFNHIVFFKYKSKDLKKVILLLKENKLYPLKHNTNGKMLIIKYLLNRFPIFTKRIIDNIR